MSPVGARVPTLERHLRDGRRFTDGLRSSGAGGAGAATTPSLAPVAPHRRAQPIREACGGALDRGRQPCGARQLVARPVGGELAGPIDGASPVARGGPPRQRPGRRAAAAGVAARGALVKRTVRAVVHAPPPRARLGSGSRAAIASPGPRAPARP